MSLFNFNILNNSNNNNNLQYFEKIFQENLNQFYFNNNNLYNNNLNFEQLNIKFNYNICNFFNFDKNSFRFISIIKINNKLKKKQNIIKK